MKIYYRFCGKNDTYDLNIPDTFNIHRSIEQETIAQLCAMDFYFNHGGDNELWPLTLILIDGKHKVPINKLDIDVEMVPSFSVMKHL